MNLHAFSHQILIFLCDILSEIKVIMHRNLYSIKTKIELISITYSGVRRSCREVARIYADRHPDETHPDFRTVNDLINKFERLGKFTVMSLSSFSNNFI